MLDRMGNMTCVMTTALALDGCGGGNDVNAAEEGRTGYPRSESGCPPLGPSPGCWLSPWRLHPGLIFVWWGCALRCCCRTKKGLCRSLPPQRYPLMGRRTTTIS